MLVILIVNDFYVKLLSHLFYTMKRYRDVKYEYFC